MKNGKKCDVFTNLFCASGHNGAGKTTLHSIITGWLQPSHGVVLIHGRDVSDYEVGTSRPGVCGLMLAAP